MHRHSRLTEHQSGPDADETHWVSISIGVTLAAVGMAAVVLGGFVAANTGANGLVGFAVILGGLIVMWVGLWIAGVDLT
jgi:hypothetical protein